MKHQHLIALWVKTAPTVELDSQAHAAYVRFNRKAVKETKVVTEESCVMTIDLDAKGRMIGLELSGWTSSVAPLLKLAGDKAEPVISRTRYTATKLVAA